MSRRPFPVPTRRRRRAMTAIAAVGAIAALTQLPARAAGAQHGQRDPEAARLVTEDVPRFWRVYDTATLADAATQFQRDYLDAGTDGLRDYAAQGRIGSGRQLAAAVALRPRYYAAVRAATLALDSSRATHAAMRAAFRRLAALHPDAVFPNVYFVIGRLESGGTVSPRGLLIGLEMYAADADTPRDELLPWQRLAVHRLDDVPALVAHELAHFQQVPDSGPPTLLARALREGGADFVAELIAGRHANQIQQAYGDAHEAALWAEFAPAMRGTDVSRWLYGSSGGGDRPTDLGYYVGYRLARAFYERAADRAAALRTIIRADDPERILRESGYAPGRSASHEPAPGTPSP